MRNGAVIAVVVAALAGAARAAEKDSKEADLGEKGEARAADTSLIEKSERPKPVKEKGPALEYEQFRSKVELQVASKRQEQMETLRKIIALGADPKEMPSLIFRLAELYWEESKSFFFQSNAKDDEIARAGSDKAKVAAAQKDKADLLSKSATLKRDTIEAYRSIVKKYPKFERNDEVLYFLGVSLHEDGKDKDSLAAYKTLIQRFPKSNYVPDAYLAFGEFYFNGGDVNKALKAYEKAAERTDTKVYGFALYKQAWCYYNLQDYTKALDGFRSVIFYGEIASEMGGENKLALVREARKDYVLTYSHDGDPLMAKSDFEKVGGPQNWHTMLEGLAGLYYSTGHDVDAMTVYRILREDQPLGPNAPLFQSRIVDCAARIGEKKQTVRETRLLVKVFQDVGSAGATKTDKDKESLADAQRLAERTLRSLAVQYHNEWKKTRDDETVQLARELYGNYLDVFPGTKYEYDMRFYFAELLYKLNEYDRAAENYTKTVLVDDARMQKKEKPGKWLQDASYAAILSWDEVVKKFTDKEKLPDTKEKREIPPVQKSLLEACERFLKLVPKTEKKVEISYKAAQIYYRYNNFDEAVNRFAWIVQEYPEHDLAEYSANLILDTFNLQQDWVKLNEWARKFKADPKLAKGRLQDDLARIVEQTSFKMVELVEKKGQFEKAAEGYVAFSREFKESDLGDLALFNASVDFVKARRLDRAIATREELAKNFPQSAMVPDAIFANGADYEGVARFAESAAAYERYAASYQKWKDDKGKGKKPPPPKKVVKKGKGGKDEPPPKEKPPQKWEEDKAQIAFFNAGLFREGMRDWKKALQHRLAYLELWPKAKDVEAVFLSIADLYERNREYPKAVKQLEEYLKDYGSKDIEKQFYAMARLLRLFQKAKNDRQANVMYVQIWDAYSRLGPKGRARVERGIEAVAEKHFKDGDAVYGEFTHVPFLLKSVDKSLKEKINRLKGVEERYGETIKLKAGGPAICALTKIGHAYKHFSSWLTDAPVPKEFNAEQADMFKAQLRDQAMPLEDKAVSYYETAVTKSRDLDIYNKCAEDAFSMLQQMRAAQYPERVELMADIGSAEPPAVQAGLLLALQPLPAKPPSEEPPVMPVAAPVAGAKKVEPAKLQDAPPAPRDEPPVPPKKKKSKTDEDEPEDEEFLP